MAELPALPFSLFPAGAALWVRSGLSRVRECAALCNHGQDSGAQIQPICSILGRRNPTCGKKTLSGKGESRGAVRAQTGAIEAVAVGSEGLDRRDGCVSSRFERSAALQAAGSVARGDESAKWTHALGREIADPRLHAQRPS